MMENDGYSYINESFIEDVNDNSNGKITEEDSDEVCYQNAGERNPSVNLSMEEKSSESGSESEHSYIYPDTNDQPRFGNKHRCSSSLDVSQSKTLPNSQKKILQNNRFSLCSVHDYVDLAELVEELKNPKKRSRRSSRRIRNKAPGPLLQCSGIAALDEGRIAVVTKSGEILLFKDTGCLVYIAEFLETFEDVTPLSNQEIAASCGFCIKFFEISDTNIGECEEKCIDYQHSGETTVHALHYVQNVFFITCNIQTCLQSNPFIRIINMKGQTLKTFSLPTIHSPGHICSTEDKKMIFLTDQVQKKVVGFDSSGTIKWEVTTDHVPQCVVVTGKKSIAVSYERESEIKRYSLKGKPLSPVETRMGPISSPFLLCHLPASDTLFICSETYQNYDRSMIWPIKLKKSKMQKIKKMFKK